MKRVKEGKGITRRQFNKALVAASVVTMVPACISKNPLRSHKTLIIGIDGMDHGILARLLMDGKMPNFYSLIREGDFAPLMSSIPAQSPVAWSNFITGKDPGGHAIFDFIHRKPGEIIQPYLSTSESINPKWAIPLGKYRVPLKGGKVVLNRRGKAFWQILGERDVNNVVFRIPSNFPPAPGENCRMMSGMGTPDMTGTYGTFSYYTDNPPKNASKVSGGTVYTVWVENHRVVDKLVGPPNTFLDGNPPPQTEAPFTVYVDPVSDAAVIEISGQKVLLKVGEWSGWVTVKFDVAPMAPSITGIVKFYLKEVRPDFKLYVTPVNIDPKNPALPISYPDDYVPNLARTMGDFYTQGMPEANKGRQNDVLDDHEYVEQALSILNEQEHLFWHEFARWKEGLLFYYFSSLDLNQHMMWRAMDPESPSYTEELNRQFGGFIEGLYLEYDRLLGEIKPRLDKETTLIIMSDHGFAPWHRAFNLNTWLLDNGYLYLNNPADRSSSEMLSGVDWSRTLAYNIGINGLYLNLKGREYNGIVDPADYDRVVEKLARELEEVVDEKTGRRPVRRAVISRKTFRGEYVNEAPDIIVCYDRGYRTSDSSALGNFGDTWFEDNKGAWSGDHCIDPEVVPGILVTNRKIKKPDPHLYDLTPTVLREYGVGASPDMVGKAVW